MISTYRTFPRSALKRTVGACLAALALATSAHAQKMGRANANAPTVTTAIAFPNATKDSIDLAYTSITWAEGQWAAELANDATKAASRANINKSAEKSPLGTFKTSVAITLGGQKVAAGSYKFAFTLDDKYKWQIVLIGESATVTCPMDLKSVEDESKRLVASLRAGEKDFTAELVVAFGKSRCALPITFEKSS